MKLLCTAPPADVFAVVETINELGGFAVAPRKVEIIRPAKQRRAKVEETPLLGGYFFANLTPHQWHEVNDTFRTVQEMCDGAWRRAQEFLAQAEQDYQYRMEQYDAGRRVAEYAPGDPLQILFGIFAGYQASFLRLDETGPIPLIKARLQDVSLLGRDVDVTVDPINARKLAAG